LWSCFVFFFVIFFVFFFVFFFVIFFGFFRLFFVFSCVCSLSSACLLFVCDEGRRARLWSSRGRGSSTSPRTARRPSISASLGATPTPSQACPGPPRVGASFDAASSSFAGVVGTAAAAAAVVVVVVLRITVLVTSRSSLSWWARYLAWGLKPWTPRFPKDRKETRSCLLCCSNLSAVWDCRPWTGVDRQGGVRLPRSRAAISAPKLHLAGAPT